MSTHDIFSNSMVLFWILVQQICLCYIKLAYEDVMGRRETVRPFIACNAVIFLALLILGFDLHFGIDLVYSRLPGEALRFYGRLKWNFFCEVMIVLDVLLAAYALRMYALYSGRSSYGSRSQASVLLGDSLIIIICLVPFLWYHANLTTLAIGHRLSDQDIRMLQFFFIKIANIVYALCEGTAAVLIFLIYRSIKGAMKGPASPKEEESNVLR